MLSHRVLVTLNHRIGAFGRRGPTNRHLAKTAKTQLQHRNLLYNLRLKTRIAVVSRNCRDPPNALWTRSKHKKYRQRDLNPEQKGLRDASARYGTLSQNGYGEQGYKMFVCCSL